jgi:hypothetical protein
MRDAMTMVRSVAMALVLFLVPSAHGAIFGWTDSEGTAHFTNNESRIPPRYRGEATLVCTEPGDGQAPPQSAHAQTALQPTAHPGEPPERVSAPVANLEQRNAAGGPAGKKYIPRHRQHRQYRAVRDEE